MDRILNICFCIILIGICWISIADSQCSLNLGYKSQCSTVNETCNPCSTYDNLECKNEVCVCKSGYRWSRKHKSCEWIAMYWIILGSVFGVGLLILLIVVGVGVWKSYRDDPPDDEDVEARRVNLEGLEAAEIIRLALQEDAEVRPGDAEVRQEDAQQEQKKKEIKKTSKRKQKRLKN